MTFKHAWIALLCVFAAVACAATPGVAERSAAASTAAAPATFGTGPYPALMEADETLAGQVIYRPANLEALGQTRLGLVLWGNGGCSDDGARAWPFLAEIASHGYVVIAAGDFLTGPAAPTGARAERFMITNVEHMRQALLWGLAENEREGSRFYHRIDTNMIAASGHSCGGMLAIMAAADPRIKALIIHNSGIIPNHARRPTLIVDRSMLDRVHVPILYVTGDSTDIAYPVANDDFAYINHVPVFLGHLNTVGHSGTFREPNGGVTARVTVDWLAWRLRGDAAARTFTGADCRLCVDPDWTVQRKGIE